jgi:hypothetical protein
MEVTMIRIRTFHGHQEHVETKPVLIDCLHLEIFSSEPGAPKWYFEKPGSRNWGSELDAEAEFNFFYPPSAGRGRS